MKATRILGVAAVACLLTAAAYADSPFTEKEARNNAAVAASPRARESFPWLTRTATSPRAVVRDKLSNAAYAKSPRVVELYPELARGGAKVAAAECVYIPELANRAFAASPRAKEVYPWLAVRTPFSVPECGCLLARTSR